MTTPPIFQHGSPWRSLLLLAWDRQSFIDVAVNHAMAVILESQDLLSKHKAGTYPAQGWEVEAKVNASRATAELCQAIRSSFIITLAITFIALVLGFSLSLIAINLPPAYGKTINASGVFLAGWATLFALGTPVRSWKGKTLPELIHPKIFIAIFIPGLLLSFLGQLW